jgi:hypothetical protein
MRPTIKWHVANHVIVEKGGGERKTRRVRARMHGRLASSDGEHLGNFVNQNSEVSSE